MRIAPHIIKPFTPKGCLDYAWDALKWVLFALSCLAIGYAFGMRANCPEQAMDSLVTVGRTCGVGLVVVGVVFVALKVIAAVRRNE